MFLAPAIYDASGIVKRWARHHHVLAKSLVVGYTAADATNPRLRGVVAARGWPWKATHAWSGYTRRFRKAFPKSDPVTGLTYYDEVEPLLEALKKVHGDTSNRERLLQHALAKLHYDSPWGPVHLDKRRQAIGPTYLARIRKGGYDQFKVVLNVEQTFGGYFTPRPRTTPGPHSPACVKGTPPPWARRSR